MNTNVTSERGESSAVVIGVVALVAIAAIIFLAIYLMDARPQEDSGQPGVQILIPDTAQEPETTE